MVELSIIIVNWNGANFLTECLRSIVESPPSAKYEIIVIDNGSNDRSVEILKSEETTKMLNGVNFRLIEREENLGFGRANNFVIEQTDAPYVFLLNPDTRVKSGAIDRLMKTLMSDERIGAVAPKLLNEDGTIQPNVWAFPPTATKYLVTNLRLYVLLPPSIRGSWLLSSHWNYSERRRVPIFSGAAIMASRKMIEDVGGFDPEYHMFGEDAEWCVRIGRKGWQLYFEPEAEIYHLGGQSAMQRWGEIGRVIKEEEGQQQFMNHCLSPFQLLRVSGVRFVITHIYKLGRTILGRETRFLDALLQIQRKALKTSFQRLISQRR
jgi:GT2 family glycosyltransferase